MTNSIYERSYTEALAILNFLDKREYDKIPTSEIDFLKTNCDKNYVFNIDLSRPLNNQNISREANAVLIVLFKKYFSTDIQRQKLNNILVQNYQREEEVKRKKYNSDIFTQSQNNLVNQNSETSIAIIPKKNIFQVMWMKLKNIFRKK